MADRSLILRAICGSCRKPVHWDAERTQASLWAGGRDRINYRLVDDRTGEEHQCSRYSQASRNSRQESAVA
jgi:hypothetical protein